MKYFGTVTYHINHPTQDYTYPDHAIAYKVFDNIDEAYSWVNYIAKHLWITRKGELAWDEEFNELCEASPCVEYANEWDPDLVDAVAETEELDIFKYTE